MSPDDALAYGDNGVGAWGDSTWKPDGPCICALPKPWKHNQQVSVHIPELGRTVVCLVRDRGPAGVVDLNPAALLAFGLSADANIDYKGATVELYEDKKSATA